MSIVEKAVEKLRNKGGDGDYDDAAIEQSRSGASMGSGAAAARDGAVGDEDVQPVHIDLRRLQLAGLAPADDLAPRLQDEYRRIKRPLLANVAGKSVSRVANGNRIMITSSLAAEGKTFTAINLSLSMALEHDYTVVLVDGDVAKPHISRVLGLEQAPGLIDVLRDPKTKVDACILPTDIPRLFILPAGRRQPNMAELLASKRMERIVAELTDGHPDRLVVFDSPPLLATSEAQVLAATMGQIVLVVKAGTTLQHVVHNALETLDQGKPINLVLNQSRPSVGGDYYGSYYGYE